MWPFIIIGLVTGGVYGLAGVGLVLTYKTSGVFNFAHGALATVSAYVFYSLSVQVGLSWPLAAAVAVLVVGPVCAFGFELLARKIVRESLAVQVAGTVGVLLIVQAAAVLLYGLSETRTVPVFFPDGQLEFGGVFINYSDLITFGIALVATALLYSFLRFTRMGTAMRAVVDDPNLLELVGTNASRVRRMAWLIGVMFAAASGVLLAPLLPLDPTLITLLVVQAFGAAALGAFRSLPLTLVGGLVIGILSSLATMVFTTGSWAGIPPAVPFIVLFVSLILLPKRYLADSAKAIPLVQPGWTAPVRLQKLMGVILAAALIAVPFFAGVHLTDWTTALGTIIIFLSLGLLVRTSGQVSLGHIGFAAIGVTAFAHLSHDFGLPWIVALLGAGLVAVPVGALMAVPAMRLSGLYLAIATFGFGIALYYVFYTQSFMFGDGGGGLKVPRPDIPWLDSDTGYYYVVLGLMALAATLVAFLTRSRLGRLLRGLAESPVALTTTGVSVNVTRLLVFCISAFMAAIGGALIGAGQGVVSASSYPPLLSLTYLVLIVIVGGRAPWYAVVAGLSLVVIPSYFSGIETSYWLQIIFGASALAYPLTPEHKRSLPKSIHNMIDRWFAGGQGTSSGLRRPEKLGDWPKAVTGSGGLLAKEIRVRFGGIVAVDGATVDVPEGRITGLIGPNGAGKTTLFNACSGLNSPTSGVVTLNRSRVDGRGPARRAQLGLGRTFQKAELFDSLSVFENVAMGFEGSRAGRSPLRQLVASARQNRQARDASWRAMGLCGIEHLASTRAGDLSTGQRRLVELARCLAGPFNILLLDEPSSGLDGKETRAFGEVLERVVAERGTGILLVEHDMELVMRLCKHIYVLDFGRIIFDGTPEEVRSSSIVHDAYLGENPIDGPGAPDDVRIEVAR